MKITITELESARNEIDITAASPAEPDPNWSHTGRDGTVHRWVRAGTKWVLPTLIHKTQTHITTDTCYECGHNHEVTAVENWWETPDGERVVPGYAHDTSRTFVPGPMTLSGRGLIVLEEGEQPPERFEFADAILSGDPGGRLRGSGVVTGVDCDTGAFAFIASGPVYYTVGSVPE
jgi:hypothetical protein